MIKTEDAIKWADRRAAIARRQQDGYVERFRSGVGDNAPDGAMENDARVYTDPQRHQKEMETIFKDYPIVAGLSQDLKEPGSIMLFEELGQSIIILRTKKGEVRAYLNMCTHRAMMLVDAPCKKNVLTCPFHGWSFDLEGDVVGMPEPEAFENIDKVSKSLVKVPVKEWAGLIFILPRPGDEDVDLMNHLGDFAIELEQLELHGSEPVKSGTMDAHCNWKYALDTYGEGYHFPTLHKTNVALFNTTESLSDRFGKHSRIGWPEKAIAEFMDKPKEEWPEPHYGGIHYIFPNTIIFYGSVGEMEPFVQIFRHFPTSTDTMRTYFNVYSRTSINSEEYREFIETAGYDGTRHVVETEDYWVATEGYKRLKSAPKGFKVLYGANEWSLQDKHKHLAEATGMPLDIYDQ